MGLISSIGKALGLGSDAPDYGPIAEANKEAARLNLEATKEALALQREMFDRTTELLSPWRAEGRRAQEAMRAVLEKGPEGFGAQYTPYQVDRSYGVDPTDVKQTLMDDPGYQFRMEQGMRAVEQQKNAQGYNRLGGTAQKALMKFGQNYASSEFGAAYGRAHAADATRYSRAMQERQAAVQDWNIRNSNMQQYYKNLFGPIQLGFGASGGLAQSGSDFANTSSNLMTDSAQFQGQAAIGAANALIQGQHAQNAAQQQTIENVFSLGRIGIGAGSVFG